MRQEGALSPACRSRSARSSVGVDAAMARGSGGQLDNVVCSSRCRSWASNAVAEPAQYGGELVSSLRPFVRRTERWPLQRPRQNAASARATTRAQDRFRCVRRVRFEDAYRRDAWPAIETGRSDEKNSVPDAVRGFCSGLLSQRCCDKRTPRRCAFANGHDVGTILVNAKAKRRHSCAHARLHGIATSLERTAF